MKNLSLLLVLGLPAILLLLACGSRDASAEPASVGADANRIVVQPAGAAKSAHASPGAPEPGSAQVYDLQLGEAVFTNTCLACHGKGAYAAPVLGNALDWKPRVTQDLNTLIQHAINGHGQMPPKGGFFVLTDLEVASAVAYAVDQSKQIIVADKGQHAAKGCDPVRKPDNCTQEELKQLLTLHMLWLLQGGGKEE